MPFQYLRILVVDDHGPSTTALSRALAVRGHACEVAHSAADALSCAAWFQPDVVLYEWHLSAGDGIGLPRRLREAVDDGITIIAVSTQDEPAAFRAVEGVDAYLTKPFDVAPVVSALAARRGEREQRA